MIIKKEITLLPDILTLLENRVKTSHRPVPKSA